MDTTLWQRRPLGRADFVVQTDLMAKKMLIDATHAEETRVVVVDGNKVEEFDFESENKRQLAGNIYLAKVTRVEPSLQAAFVDYGGNRHGFLAFSEIHPDYYQIPVADREALLEEERAYAEAMRARDEEDSKPKRRRSRATAKAEKTTSDDAVVSKDVEISGMETIDHSQDEDAVEGSSPMELVRETPVEEPSDDAADTQQPEADTDATAEEADVADNAEAKASPDAEEAEEEEDAASAVEKDDSIESVADDDDVADIRPPRKPRPRRYKIQEVIKVRQILLVQVVKEERGNKGAALTTYLSLAGRYCVLMPNTARGGGISRKITNAADRKKLKQIANDIDVPPGAGLIVRTAGAKRTKTEIKRDYEYLQRMWEQIRDLTLKSIAPAKIYEEGDLIKRSIRDLYSREIDEVLVEGEGGYRIAKNFMKMIMPSHAKNVKLYHDELPLFARYQVESYLSSMFNPTVQLKSGGYLVIGVTEALVAIDVNSGRATKEGSIEETALKTNLEAAEEVARQLRLRDLAGLIVIDFIDMDERKNNAAVEKRIKDKLKTDRARIQVGRISGFGLMEMSRQRLRPGMIEATTQACPHCHGTGLIRSDDNLALNILRQIEEEGTRHRTREVLVKCPVSIANYLMNQKREHIAQIEARYGMAVRIEGDPMLISPDFSIEKFKTATRIVAEVAAPVVSVDASLMEKIDEDAEAEEATEAEATEGTEEESKPKKRRRRRRRRSKASREADGQGQDQADDQSAEDTTTENTDADKDADKAEPQADANAEGDAPVDEAEATEEKPKKKPARKRSPRRKKADVEATGEEAAKTESSADADSTTDAEVTAAPEVEASAEEKPKKKPARKRASRSRSKKAEEKVEAQAEAAPEAEPNDAAPVAETTPAGSEVPQTADVDAVPDAKPEPAPEPVAAQATPESEQVAEPAPAPQPVAVEQAPQSPPKPKRRGWWSLGR